METGDIKKKDDGKLRMDLIPPLPLQRLAEVYGIGAKKYSDNGWLNTPIEQHRILAAMKRHILYWELGEDHDQVDGQLHMASVAWCAFTLMHYREYGLVPDERPFAPPQEEEEPADDIMPITANEIIGRRIERDCPLPHLIGAKGA